MTLLLWLCLFGRGVLRSVVVRIDPIHVCNLQRRDGSMSRWSSYSILVEHWFVDGMLSH